MRSHFFQSCFSNKFYKKCKHGASSLTYILNLLRMSETNKAVQPNFLITCFGTILILNQTDRQISKLKNGNIAHWSFFQNNPYIKAYALLCACCAVVWYCNVQWKKELHELNGSASLLFVNVLLQWHWNTRRDIAPRYSLLS